MDEQRGTDGKREDEIGKEIKITLVLMIFFKFATNLTRFSFSYIARVRL
jgi:hypothetical protein